MYKHAEHRPHRAANKYQQRENHPPHHLRRQEQPDLRHLQLLLPKKEDRERHEPPRLPFVEATSSLKRDERCDYCAGRRQVATLAPDLNAIYCISLQEQPHRTAKAAAQFHALGLCREVLFYQPVRGRDVDRAIWKSHRAVAQDAIAKGFARILVLEDDVLFTRPRETVVRRVTAALRALPSTWWGLYLGHVPIQAYFLRPNLLRVRSGCTHAYIANAPLLAWLASLRQ
jgi:hypothetical protein